VAGLSNSDGLPTTCGEHRDRLYKSPVMNQLRLFIGDLAGTPGRLAAEVDQTPAGSGPPD